MARSMMGALLGTGGVTLLDLQRRERAARGAQRGRALSHRVPDADAQGPRALAGACGRQQVPLSGFADHLVSESVYLDDPEGNGIEVYADRDPSKPGNGTTARSRWRPTSSTSTVCWR